MIDQAVKEGGGEVTGGKRLESYPFSSRLGRSRGYCAWKRAWSSAGEADVGYRCEHESSS